MKRSETDKKEEMKNLGQRHKEHLGMEVPKGYFSSSKQSILENLHSQPAQKENEGRLFRLRKNRGYALAASILLLVSLSIWFFNRPGTQGPEPIEAPVAGSLYVFEDSEDLLLTSLLVEEEEIGSFVDEVLLNEIVVKAELSEQELENIFLNSLIEDDSAADDYLEESLMKQIVL